MVGGTGCLFSAARTVPGIPCTHVLDILLLLLFFAARLEPDGGRRWVLDAMMGWIIYKQMSPGPCSGVAVISTASVESSVLRCLLCSTAPLRVVLFRLVSVFV